MSPRYRPLGPSLSAELDADFNREVQAELDLVASRETFEAIKAKRAIQLREIDPYGEGSEHSWVLDSCATRTVGGDPRAEERLNRSRAAMEKRAVSSTTLGGLIPLTIPPWVQEAVAYGLRSRAPLALALERLPLPPTGDSADWAQVSTAATANVQTAESATIPSSADLAVGSTSDALKTIAAELSFAAQALDRSGGWFDLIAGRELGEAFGARLEQQVWNGSGGSGQLTGFLVASGTSSSTVSGQTMTLICNKLDDQWQTVTNNLGSQPDLVAMAPHRAAMLDAAAHALGLPLSNLLPPGCELVASPACPTNLGGGTNEDWLLVLARSSTPLVYAGEPTVEIHREGPSAGTNLGYRFVVYGFCALGVSRRPSGIGLVKGATPPTFT